MQEFSNKVFKGSLKKKNPLYLETTISSLHGKKKTGNNDRFSFLFRIERSDYRVKIPTKTKWNQEFNFIQNTFYAYSNKIYINIL